MFVVTGTLVFSEHEYSGCDTYVGDYFLIICLSLLSYDILTSRFDSACLERQKDVQPNRDIKPNRDRR